MNNDFPNKNPVANPVVHSQSIAVTDLKGNVPRHDEIELGAYFIYRNQGSQNGHALEHWLKAERDLRMQYAASSP